MATKAYVILYNSTNRQLGFPIKSPGYYCANMPQFFGGKVESGESLLEAAMRETSEESNNKILLALTPTNSKVVHTYKTKTDDYTFFITNNFSFPKGNPFGPLVPINEMQSITSYATKQGGSDTVVQLLAALGITPTQEFKNSQTWIAFNKAIALVESLPATETVAADKAWH